VASGGIEDLGIHVVPACSGAMMAHFYKKWGLGGQWNEPAQFQWNKKPEEVNEEVNAMPPCDRDESVNLVTLSIGGNDFGFAPILDACIDGAGHDIEQETCLVVTNLYATFGKTLLEQGGTIKVIPSKDFPGTLCDRYPVK
jgi:hypothetical protein